MESLFKVPIRNLFCLLSYINELPDLVKSFNDTDEDLITYDFIANQFLKEVEFIYRRGMVKNYITITESTSHLSGRVLMSESIGFITARQPIVVCEKDLYSHNILLNQVMKSTLQAICFNRYINEETRKHSYNLMEFVEEVETPPLTKELFWKIHFGRHNLYYKRMIQIARLLHELTLLSHKHGNWSLFSAELNETSLNQIFEKFLFHFYRLEQKEYRVQSEVMQWQLEGNRTFLPSMKTDISLTHKSRQEKIVVDAKFYKSIFQENFGKSTFHSHNLYQLFTYLMHQPEKLGLRGILIYPFNGTEVNESFSWNGRFTIEVMTLNLDDAWKKIYEKLIMIVS